MAGNLIICKTLATMADQLLSGDVHALLQNHTGSHQFTPLRIRYSEYGCLAHRRMGEKDGLHLSGIDILAARDDHVLRPVQYVEVTICVLIADVAGTKEAASESSRRIPRVIPVGAHYVCSARHQFAALAGVYLHARFVSDLYLDTGTRPPA